MEQGEVMEIEADDREYAGFRSMASRYAKAFGVRYAFSRRDGIVTIKRII